jgi:hypothetical protein
MAIEQFDELGGYWLTSGRAKSMSLWFTRSTGPITAPRTDEIDPQQTSDWQATR